MKPMLGAGKVPFIRFIVCNRLEDSDVLPASLPRLIRSYSGSVGKRRVSEKSGLMGAPSPLALGPNAV